ncbi:MAG: type 4a pilus biogenesis protein PilO [Candidatus Omnitrophica bacterium]|nr:type 4a pilus biogenesis protein PilO [Candidatus Omnitrophota bacterium]
MKIKKNGNERWNKIVIVNAIIVVLVLAIGIPFVYMPFAERNKTMRADILKERDKNVLIGKIKGLGKHIKIYDKRIPDAQSVSWLLSMVSNMASKEDIKISSITPGEPEDYGLYTKLSVIVDMTVTYNQFGKFIAAIESSEKFLKIESVNMKRLDLEDKFEKNSIQFKAFDIKANIVISTIMRKE